MRALERRCWPDGQASGRLRASCPAARSAWRDRAPPGTIPLGPPAGVIDATLWRRVSGRDSRPQRAVRGGIVEGRRRSREPGFAVRRDPAQHRLAGHGPAGRAGRLVEAVGAGATTPTSSAGRYAGPGPDPRQAADVYERVRRGRAQACSPVSTSSSRTCSSSPTTSPCRSASFGSARRAATAGTTACARSSTSSAPRSSVAFGSGSGTRRGTARDHVLSKFEPDEVAAPRRAARRGGRRRRGMGAGRHEQGGQSVQHVPAARGGRGSARRSGRGRWAAGRRTASAARSTGWRRVLQHKSDRSPMPESTTPPAARAPRAGSTHRRTGRRGLRGAARPAVRTRTPSISTSPRWTPRSRTHAERGSGDRESPVRRRRGPPHARTGRRARAADGQPSPAGSGCAAAVARRNGLVRRAAGTARERRRRRSGRADTPGSSPSLTVRSRTWRPPSPIGEPLVWIARDAEIGDRVAEELGAWLGDPAAVAVLEPRTALAYERSELVADETAARVAALAAWRSGHARGSSSRASRRCSSTPSPRTTCPPSRVSCASGARLHLDQLLRDLFDLGYSPVTEVAGRGEFARRGGIVDVFPPSMTLPIRIEFFGDEIDSLRAFDPTDQRTTGRGGAGRPPARVGVPAPDRGRGRDPRAARPHGDGATARAPRARTWPASKARARTRCGPPSPGSRGPSPSATRPRCGPPTWRPRPALDHMDRRARCSCSTNRATSPRRPTSCGARPMSAAPSWSRPANCPRTWPSTYLPPRDWKARLVAARTLELTWESEPPAGVAMASGRHVVRRSCSAGASRCCRFGRSGAARRRGRAWREDGGRIVLASDQAPRLAEILGEAGHPVAVVERDRGAPPPGAIALRRTQPQRRVRRRTGRTRRSSPTGSCSGRSGSAGRRPFDGSSRATSSSACHREISSSTSTTASPATRGCFDAAGKGRSATTSSSRSPAATGSSCRSSRSRGSRATPAASGRTAQQARRRGVAARQTAGPQGGGRARRRAAGPVRRTRPAAEGHRLLRRHAVAGARWRRRSRTRRPSTSSVPRSRSRRTWSASEPMDRLVVGDVGYGKTEVALRGRIQGDPGRQAGRGARARRRCSPRSTTRPSASGSPRSRSRSGSCRGSCRPRSRRPPSTGSRTAPSTSSSAPTAC